MAVTYKEHWRLLIDRNLMKKDLEEMAGMLSLNRKTANMQIICIKEGEDL